MLASRIAKSIFLSIVLAAAFSTPMIIHAVEEATRGAISDYILPEYVELLSTVVSFIYPLSALWLGLKASSRSRASISGFTLGMARASIETVVHPNYLFYSQSFLDSVFIGALRFATVNQLNVVDNFLLRNLSYILLGTFIASLGGLYGYLNRLSHPLKRTGGGIYVFRDYWSNRQRFEKNRFPENPSLDLSSQDKPLGSPAPELVLRLNGGNVDVIETFRGQIVASNLQNPHYLALRYEPQWNPIPLAIETKISKLVIPVSVLLSLLTVLLSANDLYSLFNQAIIYINYGLIDVIGLINVIGSTLLPTFLPVLVAYFLSLVLILKVNNIRKIKPESSLTMLFLTLFMPILTYGTFSVTKAATAGDILIVRIWLFILLFTLAILLFSSLRIRDFENVSMYLYQNTREDMSPLWYQQDKPVWAQGDFYWVIRYMYYWPMEMTFPLPHTDWERVEVWVNARTGQAEWILTDYHYRELWYEVVGPVSRVYVDFDPNFHTPLPINSNDELENIQKVLFYRLSVLDHIVAQAKYMLKGKWYNLWVGISFESQIRAMFRQMHSQELLQQITGSKIIASNLASLYWKNWRYPQGADRKDFYSATAKNLPATIVM